MPAEGPGGPAVLDERGRAERRARRAWEGRPGAGLRAGSLLYGLGVRAWSWAWETGLARAAAAPIPVVSVGGVTVGGSGKTPLAAALARMLEAGGIPAAVVTRGFPDELALHARLGGGRPVVGHRDRTRAVREAMARGARAAVLDDGFQHRRLARDVDVVALDADFAGRVPWRLLPAGPYREPPGALGRADRVVVTRREAGPASAGRLAAWVRRRLPGVPVARCALEPGRVVAAGRGPAEPAGAAAPGADPAVVLAGVMKPRPFLAAVRAAGLAPEIAVVLPDHGVPRADLLDAIAARARRRGVVTTAKDAVRLSGLLPADVPLLVLEERLTWEEGEDELRAGLVAAVLRAEGRRVGDHPTSEAG